MVGHLARFIALGFLLAAAGATFSSAKDAPYRPPEPGGAWIRANELSLKGDKKAAVAEALTGLACLPGKVTPEQRSRAIGLAFQVVPGFEPAIIANFKLRNNQPLSPAEGFAKVDQVVSALVPIVRELMPGGQADRDLGWAILHLLVKLPGRVDAAILLFEQQGELADPPWERLYGGKATAAGPAQDFARRESTVAVLVLARSGKELAGKVVWVSAAAMDSKNPLQPARILTYSGSSPGVRRAAELAGKHVAELWKARWPVGETVMLATDAKADWAKQDEASFGAGFALLLSALVKDSSYDPGFGVIGQLGVDGRLEAAPGLESKLRAAIQAGLTHVAVAAGLRDELMDLLVTGAYAGLTRVQILSASRMAEVDSLAVAPGQRDAGLREAMVLFGEAVRELGPSISVQSLRTPPIRSKLERVVELAPNHVSAKLLSLAAGDQIPPNLSLAGSLRRVLPAYDQVFRLDSDVALRELQFSVRNLRAKFHPAVRPAADAVAGYAESQRAMLEQQRGGKWLGLRDLATVHEEKAARLREEWIKLEQDPAAAEIFVKLRAEGN